MGEGEREREKKQKENWAHIGAVPIIIDLLLKAENGTQCAERFVSNK